MMIIREIDILSQGEFQLQHVHIAKVGETCWLKPVTNLGDGMAPTVSTTSAPAYSDTGVRLRCGVRPAMIIEGYFMPFLKGDKINIFVLQWTILNVLTKTKIEVLCDEVVAVRAYDKGSNDWEFSDLKKWLQEWCRYMCLGSEDISYGLDIAGISLLSEAQYKEYKRLIRPLNEEWWLQDVGDGFGHGPTRDLVKTVDGDGNIRKFGSLIGNQFAVRPTTCIELESGHLNPGDRLRFLDCDWTVLDAYEGVNKLQVFVLCDQLLMRRRFDCKNNDFFASEIYEWLIHWCELQCIEVESINYKGE